MLGCRALSPKEVQLISNELSLRNRCIFILGIRTGFRIRELLSLDIQDVLDERGNIRGTVKVYSRNVKGKTGSQAVPLHDDAKDAIRAYLKEFPGRANDPLFRSVKSGRFPGGMKLEYTVYNKALKAACLRAEVDGMRVSTHSQRKTFASNLYKALNGDVFKLQRAMRHSSVNSTAAYIEVNELEVMDAIKRVK